MAQSFQRILRYQIPLYRQATGVEYSIFPETTDLVLDLQAYLQQAELYLNVRCPAVSRQTLVAWRTINQHWLLSLSPDHDSLFRLGLLIFSLNVVFPGSLSTDRSKPSLCVIAITLEHARFVRISVVDDCRRGSDTSA